MNPLPTPPPLFFCPPSSRLLPCVLPKVVYTPFASVLHYESVSYGDQNKASGAAAGAGCNNNGRGCPAGGGAAGGGGAGAKKALMARGKAKFRWALTLAGRAQSCGCACVFVRLRLRVRVWVCREGFWVEEGKASGLRGRGQPLPFVCVGGGGVVVLTRWLPLFSSAPLPTALFSSLAHKRRSDEWSEALTCTYLHKSVGSQLDAFVPATRLSTLRLLVAVEVNRQGLKHALPHARARALESLRC